MREIYINGELRQVPTRQNETSDEVDLYAALGLPHNRQLIRQSPDGNEVVPRGEVVLVRDLERYLDAPLRIKG